MDEKNPYKRQKSCEKFFRAETFVEAISRITTQKSPQMALPQLPRKRTDVDYYMRA